MSIYRKALSERSSYIENVLIHQLVGLLAGALWKQDPRIALTVFNAEVDDSGFDLVLGCGPMLRYLQIKQTHLFGRVQKFSIRQDFSQMVGSCVVLIVFAEDTLTIDHFQFYGGQIDEPMPAIDKRRSSVVPGRRAVDGSRKIRDHYRDISRSKFDLIENPLELLDRLFHISSSE